MKAASRHRITGFYSAHVSQTPKEPKLRHIKMGLSTKWRNTKALVYSRGLQEVWYPSKYTLGAKPIFKRDVDPAEILGKVKILLGADLAKGDSQVLYMFIHRSLGMRRAKISIAHTALSQIREAADLISSREYDPSSRPAARKKKKRSQAAVQSGNLFVKKRAKRSLENVLQSTTDHVI